MTGNRLLELEIEARIREARLRAAEVLHQEAKDIADSLSREAAIVLISDATLLLTGQRLVPLPESGDIGR